jgi:hypothetical protein
MTPRTASDAFADAAAALVHDEDVADVLLRLLQDCAGFTRAAAVGVIVRGQNGGFEVLAATSHRVGDLEIYQIQQDEGPCLDAVGSGAPVAVCSPEEIVELWPTVGEAMVAMGYQSVYAQPMSWRDRRIGGLNLFRTTAEPLGASDAQLVQAFADLCTAVILHGAATGDLLAEGVRRALYDRVVIERAKGVLAEQRSIDMPAAYEVLLQMTAERATTLTETASQVVRSASTTR